MNVQDAKEIKILQSKNLLRIPSIEELKALNSGSGRTWSGDSLNYHGIDYIVNNDGSISVSGIAESTGSYFILGNTGDMGLVSGGSYTLSGCPAGGNVRLWSLRVYVGSSYSTDGGSGVTIGYTDSGNVRINIFADTELPADGLTFWPQLEAGTRATEYEPYVAPQDVKTIHDKDKKLIWGKVQYDTKYMGDLEQVNYDGKNLFNNAATPPIKSSSMDVTPTDTGMKLSLTALPNNTRYAVWPILSMDDHLSEKVTIQVGSITAYHTDGLFRLAECDSDGSNRTTIANVSANSSYTYTIPSAATGRWLAIQAYGCVTPESAQVDGYVEFFDAQFAIGSSATSYEPYVGGTSAPNPDYPQPINVAKGTQTIDIYGKNMLNVPNQTLTSSGVTWVWKNGKVTASATSATSTSSYACQPVNVNIVEGNPYVFSLANTTTVNIALQGDNNGTWETLATVAAGSTSSAFVATKNYTRFQLVGSGWTSGAAISTSINGVQLEVKENLIKGTYQASSGLISAWNPRGDTVHTSGTATATAVGLMPLDSAGVPSGHRYRYMISTAIQFGVKLKVNYTDGGYVQPVINAGSTYIDFDIPSDKIVASMAVQSTGMTVGTSYNSTFSVALVDITPSPYEAYQHSTKKISLSSKNLFSFNNGVFAVGPSSSNVSQTHTDNSVHMEAIGTTGAQYVKVDYSGLDSSKNYTISCKAKKIVKGTDGRPRLKLNIYKSSDGSTWSQLIQDEITDPVQGQEYTLSSTFTGYQYYRFYFYNNTYTPVTVGEETEYWDIQLEEGDTATTYEPYHIALGKNLFNYKNVELGKNYSGGIGTVVYPFPGVQSSRASVIVPVSASTSYNFSMTSGSLYLMEVRECDGNYVVTKLLASPMSDTFDFNFTTQSNGAFLVMKFKVGSAGTDDVTQAMVDSLKMQIEEGSTSTTYEPYAQTPLELAGLNQAQDYFYYNSGNWYLKRKVGEAVMDGSNDESWLYQSATTVFTLNDYVDYDKTLTFSPICNYFLGASIASYNQLPDHYVSFLRGASANNRFVLKYTAYSDATALKTWLSTHPLTVYYALAMATDTQITYPALVAQLEAIRDWMIRAGYTQTVVGDLPIIINKEDL